MLAISPISFKSINLRENPKRITFGKNVLERDVFVKSTSNAPQQGKTVGSGFVQWAEEHDLALKLQDIITDKNNVLGEGFCHVAYSIPDCDEYVLRISNDEDISNIQLGDIKIKNITDINFDINFGQRVGIIKAKNKGKYPFTVEILKKQKGVPVGNPPYSVIMKPFHDELKPGEEPYDAVSRKENYAKFLDKIAKLPLESYEKLIDDYQKIANYGYALDHMNSNNLFLDEENEEIHFIDMTKSRRIPNYGNLLYALTNIGYFDTYSSNNDETVVSEEKIIRAIKNTNIIMIKFFMAMQNKHLKFDRDNQSEEFSCLLESTPMTYLFKTDNQNMIWRNLEKMDIVNTDY